MDLRFYNQQVKEYNTLVGQYNRLYKEVTEGADLYNAQVEKYDQCVR